MFIVAYLLGFSFIALNKTYSLFIAINPIKYKKSKIPDIGKSYCYGKFLEMVVQVIQILVLFDQMEVFYFNSRPKTVII